MISTMEYNSDDEINPYAHKILLDGVNSLRRTQHIKKPTRTEPSLVQDEFHLFKSATDKDALVSANDLIKLLKKTNQTQKLIKDLKKIDGGRKTLQKPLEKPVADQIQRKIAYQKTKKKLSKWDAIVAKNRMTDHQVFPYETETVYINTGAIKKPPPRTVKNELAMEMEALELKLKEIRKTRNGNNDSDNEEVMNDRMIQEKLTKDELIARRKEIAYLRMKQSQESRKARMKNKIKSKKYHKLLKREKLKQQLKEFEILQKTNPEAALEKLNKLEKSRIEERANLRHKNTGTWAKNLQVRAKYDRDVRKDLAEQLALSRELTQKQKDENDQSDNDDDNDNESNENEELKQEKGGDDYDPFNPWIKIEKKSGQKNEVADFVSGYRKYWMERNKNEVDMKAHKEDLYDLEKNNEQDEVLNDSEQIKDVEKNKLFEKDIKVDKELEEGSTSSDESSSNSETDIKSFKQEIKSQEKEKENMPSTSKKANVNKKSSQKKKNRKRKITIENGWLVEECDTNVNNTKNFKNIDVIFDEAEDILQEKISKKLNAFQESLKSKKTEKMRKGKTKKDALQNLKDLSFKESINKPEFDEELIQTSAKEKENHVNETNEKLSTVVEQSSNNLEPQEIDPNKYAKIIPILMKNSIPDLESSEALADVDDVGDAEEIEADCRDMTIAEAFEDDDIIADFDKEREDLKKNDNDEIDLSLPGWGTWGGIGIPKDKQRKRFILKFPKEQPRRDENKEHVYINEDKYVNEELKKHLVSDLPFPFISVKDFEASIRAPIGQTFVPETAFRMLTRPSVVTKNGHIIKPMDETILTTPPTKPRTIVDQRIANLKKGKTE